MKKGCYVLSPMDSMSREFDNQNVPGMKVTNCWKRRKSAELFKCQSRKMVKHTQTIRRQIADELFECV